MARISSLITRRARSASVEADLNPVAAHLVAAGLVSIDMANQAAELSRRAGRTIGQTLLDLGVVSEEHLFSAYSHMTGLPVWDGRGDIQEALPLAQDFLLANRILPITGREGALLVVADAEDDGLITLLQRLFPDTAIALYPEPEIQFRLETHFQIERSADDLADTQNDAASVERLKDLALEAPIIRQVNDLISAGVKMGASDIHLEPTRNRIELRYRVDGVLHNRPAPAPDDYPAIVSRIKILAQLDIAERRVPQDGRIKLKTSGKDVDIRVSTLPAAFGEDLALRLLDQKKQVLDLEALGFSSRFVDQLRVSLRHSHGLILVTGPTGSGKTTGLYAGLRDIIDGRTKIVTVEDPIEYEIGGLTQIQVNPDIGMGFPDALRSILRHDPDVIFIGEIRDRETAEIAVQSALTGHLVLSTIHTNSALGAIDRLMNMGVADYLISSSLLAVTGQRLVRALCPKCRRPEPIDSVVAERFRIPAATIVHAAVGCHDCAQIGFRGRVPINEILVIDKTLRQMILTERSPDGMLAAAREAGFVTMIDDGMAKVVAGVTTVEEVLRVAN